MVLVDVGYGLRGYPRDLPYRATGPPTTGRTKPSPAIGPLRLSAGSSLTCGCGVNCDDRRPEGNCGLLCFSRENGRPGKSAISSRAMKTLSRASVIRSVMTPLVVLRPPEIGVFLIMVHRSGKHRWPDVSWLLLDGLKTLSGGLRLNCSYVDGRRRTWGISPCPDMNSRRNNPRFVG
jgi:hypothetical protein